MLSLFIYYVNENITAKYCCEIKTCQGEGNNEDTFLDYFRRYDMVEVPWSYNYNSPIFKAL